MARVTCAISGLRLQVSFLENLNLAHTEGFIHPLFAAPYKTLHSLYSRHCRGELTSNDSYLLFLAFLHSSDCINWKHPCTLNPNEQQTKVLVENNLAQLVAVLEKSALIRHPSFSQPAFNVSYENCKLGQIQNWIKAWDNNITYFYSNRASEADYESLQKVENKLTKLIMGGESPERFAHVVADWAAKAAEFPPQQAEQWKGTIRSCFSINKMFNTPLVDLKEIKDYCECNIEAGSIHFHTLCQVLKEGISRHIDYLGGSSLALGYTLLSPTREAAKRELKNEAELAAVIANAPAEIPQQSQYDTSLEFLRASLAYRVAKNAQKQARKIEATKLEQEGEAL